ncbi:hypothetical protein [Phaffia rhodozyma]|uniref:Uncharacterized protein n=1 Tax=Phaffia rhodozyma TaxID=264483 RepID=A0A0F7SXV3_PHARH|nr:hypothetical protein [Phaffia rhodozyma]
MTFLKIESYRDDTSRLLTNFLNHPDKVDEASLEEAFIGKAEAWKSQYDELYSTAVLEAPRSTYFWSRENPSTPSEPAKPVDEEYRDATQASTHNSVWLVANKACLTNRESREHNRIQQTKVAEKAWAKKSVSKLPSNRTSENYDPDLFYHQTSHSLGQWGCTKVGVPHHPLAGWGMGSECYPHDFHWKEMQLSGGMVGF